jgi:hypothetical protein
MVVRAASSRRTRRRRASTRLFLRLAVCLLVHVSSRVSRARGVEEDEKTHRTDADADADASVPPLTRAVSDGNLPEVIALLKSLSLPESCDARTAYGETALHVASIEPRGEVLAALLRTCGTRTFLDARTRGGRYLKMTALHWMVHGGTKAHEEGVEALLRAGADATLRNEEGATARDVALAFADGEYRRNVLRMLDAHDGGRGKESVEGDGEL